MEKITSGLPPFLYYYTPSPPNLSQTLNKPIHTHSVSIFLYLSISIYIFIYTYIYTQSISTFICHYLFTFSLSSLSYASHLARGFRYFLFSGDRCSSGLLHIITYGSTELPCGLLSADI